MYRLGTLKQVVMGMILLTLTAGKMHASPEDERLRRIEIAHGWKIKSLAPRASLDMAFLATASRGQSSEGWTDVGAMPATVHDILLRQGKIEDPWLPRGTEKCFWVGQQDWIYVVQFTLDKQGPEAWLRFKGIENKVDIYLNGERLASHAGKLPLAIQVNGRLHSENSLVLHCHGDARPGKGRRSDRGSYLGPNPAISSVGVFGSVFVEISDGYLLQEVVTDVSLDEALTKGTVIVDAVGTSPQTSVELRVRLYDPDGQMVSKSTVPVTINNGKFVRRCTVSLNHPRLWWPRLYGDQPLYHAEVSLLANNQVQQTERRTIGFRRITMSEPLHFVVNGVPVFLRGGDWVTPNLMSDLWDQARHERLFALAENANFNAFRVWGQAEAPQDPFYEMADARGFLLWQDFTRMRFRGDEESIQTSTLGLSH